MIARLADLVARVWSMLKSWFAVVIEEFAAVFGGAPPDPRERP